MQGYPANCQSELDKYDEEVTKFFGLSRKSPMDIEMERREAEAAAMDAAAAAAVEAQGTTLRTYSKFLYQRSRRDCRNNF